MKKDTYIEEVIDYLDLVIYRKRPFGKITQKSGVGTELLAEDVF